jgi:hypothetical protein
MCLCLFKHIKVYRHKWTYTNTYLFYHSYLMNDIEWRKKKNLLPYIITKNAYIAWSIWSILIVYITRALLQRAYRRIYDFEWAHKNKRLWTCIYIYDRWSNTDEWIGYNYIYMMIVKDTYIHTHTDIKAHSLIFKKRLPFRITKKKIKVDINQTISSLYIMIQIITDKTISDL